MIQTLQRQLESLYGLERRKDKLGLDGTRALLGALGDPQRRFKSVHVAGTNGKGSVCAVVERALRAAGHRTGLFTSPHLVDFRERIRVDGAWADEARLAARLEHVQRLPEGADRTFFEVCTALAFDDFAARGVTWAVVEVGLGGRLDTTNVLEPELCVITSIGLDHTEILGPTLERIAAEKAGIIKRGVPVIEAVEPGAARDVILAVAAERGAPVTSAGSLARREPAGAPGERAWSTAAFGPLRWNARASARVLDLNTGTALAALAALAARGVRLPAAAVLTGCREARWPGRLERCPDEPRLWWDGAHNPQGAEALARLWREEALPDVAALALAVSADKPLEAMLEPLARIAPARRLIATRSRSERAMPAERVAAIAGAAGWNVRPAADVPAACRLALEGAAPDAPALLTGSLFAVGEAMEALGGAPGEQL